MHKCPKRGCGARVPYRLFACRQHWELLSPDVQFAIYGTARLQLLNPARRAAIDAAREDWGDAIGS